MNQSCLSFPVSRSLGVEYWGTYANALKTRYFEFPVGIRRSMVAMANIENDSPGGSGLPTLRPGEASSLGCCDRCAVIARRYLPDAADLDALAEVLHSLLLEEPESAGTRRSTTFEQTCFSSPKE